VSTISAIPVYKNGGIYFHASLMPNRRSNEGMEPKLYVGNLSYNTTEEGLRTLLGQAGTVASVDMIMDRETGRPKGFAFVVMGSQAEAEKAISMFNEKDLDDRIIKVNIAKPREERPRSGGYNDRRY